MKIYVQKLTNEYILVYENYDIYLKIYYSVFLVNR